MDIGGLSEFWWLNVYINCLNGNILVLFGNCSCLYVIYFFNNEFFGNIFWEIFFGCLGLWVLSILYNRIVGVLLVEVGILWVFWSFDLMSNLIMGSIFVEFFWCLGFNVFVFGDNFLFGSFFYVFGCLLNFECFDVSSN